MSRPGGIGASFRRTRLRARPDPAREQLALYWTEQSTTAGLPNRWVSPRRNATIADLQRGKDAGELRSDAEPELLNDAIFGAIYYRLLLRSGPLTGRFGEELVEHVLRGQRAGSGRGRSD